MKTEPDSTDSCFGRPHIITGGRLCQWNCHFSLSSGFPLSLMFSVTASTQHPARHSQAKHSHLQSPCFVPWPETARSSVGSEGIKPSFSEQPLISLIPWAVCKGPSQTPHTVPGSEGSPGWCRNPSGWIPPSTPRAWSCRCKGSLWEQSPSHPGSNLSVKLEVYILVTCGWIYKFTQKTPTNLQKTKFLLSRFHVPTLD